jgi:hypothetical protein
LYDALRIAIQLPEVLAEWLLRITPANVPEIHEERGLHVPPLNFVLEVSGSKIDAIVGAVASRKAVLGSLYRYPNAARTLLGATTLVGPLTFGMCELDFELDKERQRSLGGHRWGAPVSEVVTEAAKDIVSGVLQKRLEVNKQYLTALTKCGLDRCYFGTVWAPVGWKGKVDRWLSAVAGKASLLWTIRRAPLRALQ